LIVIPLEVGFAPGSEIVTKECLPALLSYEYTVSWRWSLAAPILTNWSQTR
jgi:hypothetical protein